MDNMNLSQEEIDALLRKLQQSTEVSNANAGSPPDFTDADKDVIGEIANISLGSAATSLSHLLGKRVEITTPTVRFLHRSNVELDFPRPYAVVTVSYASGLSGTNVLLLALEDALTIADLMLGGNGKPQQQEVGELQLSALAEAMNQMMGGAATAMSNVFERRVDITTPHVQVVELNGENPTVVGPEDWLVQVSFRLRIADLVDSMLVQFIPYSFAREMLDALQSSSPEVKPDPASQAQGVPDSSEPDPAIQVPPPPEIRRAEFEQFESEAATTLEPIGNLELLMDVSLVVTVELGRTRRQLRELLALGPGAVIELDKLAGEPVDILVNNKRIAVGEVVVIDESFGVRVTDILSPVERMSRLRHSAARTLSSTGS